MKAYKGFNADMTCRGFQYREGETYETDKAELCSSGFHACERPLDVLRYYDPAHSVFHEVEIEAVSNERKYDSKVCGKKITIGAKLSIGDLVKAHVEYTKQHCTMEHTDPSMATAGYCGAATAGDHGAATAGNCGAATAGGCGAATAGDHGAATAGYCGAATAGEYGAATAGDHGAATAGDHGAATAGKYGAATAGKCGAATSRGKSEVGKNGVAVARGNDVRVKGGMGAVLVLVEENKYDRNIKDWRAFVVDGETIKADTWYALVDGELKEVEA